MAEDPSTLSSEDYKKQRRKTARITVSAAGLAAILASIPGIISVLRPNPEKVAVSVEQANNTLYANQQKLHQRVTSLESKLELYQAVFSTILAHKTISKLATLPVDAPTAVSRSRVSRPEVQSVAPPAPSSEDTEKLKQAYVEEKQRRLQLQRKRDFEQKPAEPESVMAK